MPDATSTDATTTGGPTPGSPEGAAGPLLVPAPQSVRTTDGGGAFAPDAHTTLYAAPGTERAERWLRGTVGAALGLPLAPGGAGAANSVTLLVDEDLEPEAYRLTVTAGTGVEIRGGSGAGVFWGAQTLRQLLGPAAFRAAPVGPSGAAVAAQTIEDAPRFGWRGMMLDVARHFSHKSDVLRMLDLLAAHKLNVFHFHLTDDQGWRIEIKRHPRLTEVASWRSRTKWGHRYSDQWDEKPYGGYYTQDDIREIVAYAAERHIRVVPEFDIPGHSQAAIAAYPELGNTDVIDTSALTPWETWGINPNVLAPTEAVLRFYEGVLEEVLELFPADVSPYIHLGGDECPKDQWKASPTAQARIEELGVGDEDGLQAWFMRHFDKWLTQRGRRLIGWDEILEGGLAAGATVSSWRGYEGGIEAAKAGHDVVMCPEHRVYLDHRQTDDPDEPIPMGFVQTLESVYRFEPVPPELTPEAAKHVIGTQANVWTEVMQERARVDYQVFPRLVALAEVAWSQLPAPEERDFADFERRMGAHYPRLDALGVGYRPPTGPLPWQKRPGVKGYPREAPTPNV
ncbi:beta-N-acetylhexosaminidase [Streptomyces sp. NPDC047315]|uniref:beta-N-acetylhexosaminidase n=1 Tax=Streptomyces sp. NPDC047315 TaxID=3155142 RepID=UPI0033C2158D